MRTQLLCLTVSLVSLCSFAADAVPEGRYYDDVGMRYLSLEKAGSDSTRVIVRMAAEPGSTARWAGIGQRKDRLLIFAQEVEDGQDRGSFYTANVSESKVEIALKPSQTKPVDAGIVGTYHRTSEQKLLQLAKKEAQAAAARMQTAFRDAAKKWTGADRPALSLWKEQWPGLRDRLTELGLSASKKDPKTKEPAPNPADKPAPYWFKLAEVNAQGYGFVEGAVDPKVGTGWDGEYDDFAGGHASITVMKAGGLHVTLTFSRAGEAQNGTIDAQVKVEDVSKDKNGNLAANFTFADPEVPDASQQAKIHLTKLGHYLEVETENTQHYSVRGWFNGIYRGQPPAKE